jgi:hypothetical protein
MGIYNTLLTHLDRIKEGKEMYIPNPHVRMRDVFNLYKGRFILVGSDSGVGKTAFTDDSLILKPYSWIEQQAFSYHYEVLYYSMERATRTKLAKWLSWKIYQDKGLKISSEIFSVGCQGDIKLDNRHTALAKEYEPWMNTLLSHITIHQGPQYPNKIRDDIEKAASRLLYKVTSDNVNIFLDGKKQGEFDPKLVKETAEGILPYRVVKLAGERVEIYPNSKTYVLKNSNTFFFIVVDHLSKLKGTSKKAAIDEVVEILSIARDDYQMCPIAVSQFNRDIDTSRLKFSGGNLEPATRDFKDSNEPVEAADLIIAPFDPYKYGSFNKEGNYRGYNLTSGLLSPEGKQRFRSTHIIKNSYGTSNLAFGMRFTGEVMDYKLLPLPDSPDLVKIYEEIAKGN